MGANPSGPAARCVTALPGHAGRGKAPTYAAPEAQGCIGLRIASFGTAVAAGLRASGTRRAAAVGRVPIEPRVSRLRLRSLTRGKAKPGGSVGHCLGARESRSAGGRGAPLALASVLADGFRVAGRASQAI